MTTDPTTAPADEPRTHDLGQPALVEALLTLWDSLEDLLSSLTPEQWALPTCLPGWTVSDVVAHIIGTEAMLAGETMPTVTTDVSVLPHVANDIAAFNEIWVESLRGTPPTDVLATFRETVARRAEMLKSMSQADFDAPSWTPVGQATYGRFMQIRIYDTWMHEQDIRAAVGKPGHQNGPAAESSLAEVVRALGYIVGKRAAMPDGTRVLLDLTGPLNARIAVAVDGRAAVVPRLDSPATVTVRMPTRLFLWLSGGRSTGGADSADIEIDGDSVLGCRMVDNLAFTI